MRRWWRRRRPPLEIRGRAMVVNTTGLQDGVVPPSASLTPPRTCHGPYCEVCGDCVRCYAEDECVRSPDGKHHA